MGMLCPKRFLVKQKIPIFFILFLSLILTNQLKAQSPQTLLLRGIVVSDPDGSFLPGATVKTQRTGGGVVTDQNGKFQLVTSDSSGVLMISFIGYRATTIRFNRFQTGPFVIRLKQDAGVLKEVTVSTGYQTLPKERATGSFAKVDNQLLNRRVSTDVLSRLEGVVPGLLFNRNTVNGAAGQVDISIRGHNTLFANDQPLIVVDGFPYDGDISNINPNDIEEITVLKDAAAASIWGVRSGNGVIVLTTKKGQRNQKLAIDLNSGITIGNKPDLYYNKNFLASKDFIALEQSLFNWGAYDSDLLSGYLPVSPVVALLAANRNGVLTDAALATQLGQFGQNDIRQDLSKYFYRRSILQQYTINLKGGSDKSDYFFSLGEDHNAAGQVGNQSNRVSVNTSFNFYPIKNLQVSAQINYIRSTAQNNSNIQAITTGSTGAIYPYAKLADADGNALPIVKDYASSYTDTAGHGKFQNWQYRPLDELHLANNTIQSTDNRINLGLKYNFFKFLNAEIRYQYEGSSTEAKNGYSQSTYYARNLINQFSQFDGSGKLITPIPVAGILQQSGASLASNRVRGQLNFNNSWNGKHELTAILGAEVSDAISETNAATIYGYDNNTLANISTIDFATNDLVNPDGSTRQIPVNQGLSKATDRYISYYSNAGYTFNSRYTFTASARIDRSNLFGVRTNQKAVPLYSVGTGWGLSKEDFYHLAWLPYLKFRATLGYTGNINKSATAVTTIQQFSPSTYSGIPYSLVINPGNPELRWEKVRMINFGLDFASKNDIISGSLEFYQKRGTDLFGDSPLAPSTGLTTFFGNMADIAGSGIDLVINTHNIRSGGFNWTTNFLLSHVADKVTKYNVTLSSSNYIFFSNSSSIYPLEGKSLYGLYSYRWAGLTHDTGDPQGYLNGKVSTDYSGIISNTSVQDMEYSGSSRPTTFGSFRNTFSYQNLSLSLNIIYKLNYYFRRSSFVSSGLPYSGNEDYYRRWQAPGDELHTQVPSLEYPPYTSNRDDFYKYSSLLIDKGDHVRLQDITLGYDFDKRRYKGLPFAQLRVYTYINNVGILWRDNRDRLDPDLSGNTTAANYPLPRTYSLGLKVNF